MNRLELTTTMRDLQDMGGCCTLQKGRSKRAISARVMENGVACREESTLSDVSIICIRGGGWNHRQYVDGSRTGYDATSDF